MGTIELWMRTAKILSREVAYRSGSVMSRVPAMASSLIWALLLTAFSISATVNIVDYDSFIHAMGFLGLIELLIGAFINAGSIHVILENRLLDLVIKTPMRSIDVQATLLIAGLKWGLALLPLAVIPGMLISACRLGLTGAIPWCTAEAITMLLFSYGLGYIAESLERSRSGRLRVMSILFWFAFFSVGLLLNLTGILKVRVNVKVASIFPPFSFPAASTVRGIPTLSSIIVMVASPVLAWVGSKRFLDFYFESGSKILLRKKKITITGGRLKPMINKELKLIFRNPKLTASTFYYLLLGPLISIPLSEVLGIGGKLSISLVALLSGCMGGASVIYPVIAEGEGARYLYILPIKRGELFIHKALSLSVLSSPVAAILGLYSYLKSGPIMILLTLLAYISSLIGVSLINSSLLEISIPQKISSWTYSTFSRVATGILLVELCFCSALLILPTVVPERNVFPAAVGVILLCVGLLLTWKGWSRCLTG